MAWGAVVLLAMGCAIRRLPPSAADLIVSPPPDDALITGPVRTVVLDAGHGGEDPGTSHFGLEEKRLALDIARRLQSALEDTGLKVIMTRTGDHFIPLSDRAAIANRAGADLFVSIHLNANPSQWVSGAEVYYPRESVTATTAAWPPHVQSSEVAAPTMTIKRLLWDMLFEHVRAESQLLADSVCGELRQELDVSCKDKPARFVVLREAWMPAVLVEVGYVSNRSEARRIETPEYRETAARAIAAGLLRYIRQVAAIEAKDT